MLDQPELIVSVAGSVQNFELSRAQEAALEEGLLSVAGSKKAWFHSGGTDCGSFKLLGDAWKRHGITAPLIGYASYGATNGRERLVGDGGARAYGQQAPAGPTGAPLNADHSHFVLVDTGHVGGASYGTETNFCTLLENALALGRSSSWCAESVRLRAPICSGSCLLNEQIQIH